MTSRPRLAVAGIHHEANTFSERPATLADYRDGGILTGEAIVAKHRAAKSTIAGYLAADPEDAEIVPLLAANVQPCGAVTREAFETICAEMAEALSSAGHLDGVLLAIHGACVAEGHLDADADIAALTREIVGPDVPIGCVPDMHANLSRGLIEQVDAAVAYQTNPHIDPRERAVKCRRLIIDMVRTGSRPALVLEQLPLIVTIVRQDTRTEPMAGLVDLTRRVEERTGALDVSLVEGFPYADVPQMGMSVLAMHHDPEQARAAAREVATAVWRRRDELQGGAVGIADAVARISAHRGIKPLLVLDVGDNIGGGGPADATALLSAVMEARVSGVVTTLHDPGAVAALRGRPVGERVTVRAGGHIAGQPPVELSGTLTGRHHGAYEEPRIAHGGFRFWDGGEMVGVRTDGGIGVALTSKRVQPVTPVQMEIVGLPPAEFTAVIAKGVNGPRAGFADTCEDLCVVDTPGVTQNSVTRFDYQHRRRPMYPFESGTRYPDASG